MAVAISEIQAGLSGKASTVRAIFYNNSRVSQAASPTYTNVTNNNLTVDAYQSIPLTGATEEYTQTEINGALSTRLAIDDVVVNDLFILFPEITAAHAITITTSLVLQLQKLTSGVWESMADSTFINVPTVGESYSQEFVYSTTVSREINQNQQYRLQLTTLESGVTVPNFYVIFKLES